MIVAPNFRRQNVVAGFPLEIQSSGLVPLMGIGLLFAQGVAWQPAVAPTLPAAPVSQFSYLGYNSTTGLYWTTNPAGATADDAILGWALADATDLVVVSNQNIPVAPVGGSVVTGGGGGTGGGTGIPPSAGTPIPFGIETLPSSGNLIPNCSNGWTHQSSLTGAATVKPPINGNPGDTFCVQLIQLAGGCAVGFDAYYHGLAEFLLDTRGGTYAGLVFQIQPGGATALLLFVAMNGNKS